MQPAKYMIGDTVTLKDGDKEVKGIIKGIGWFPVVGYQYQIEYTQVIIRQVKEKEII